MSEGVEEMASQSAEGREEKRDELLRQRGWLGNLVIIHEDTYYMKQEQSE